MKQEKKWRLGIDLGTNSLGWAVLELKHAGGELRPYRLEAAGSRIFSDGRKDKGKQSNAAERRTKRGARRNRDRYLNRRRELMKRLKEYGLMPKDKTEARKLEKYDPWILRYLGLSEELSLHQFGRVLFHLHQHRGFKSNRKVGSEDKEGGKAKAAMRDTEKKLKKLEKEEGVPTLGAKFGKMRWEVQEQNKEHPKGQRQPQPRARVKNTGEGKELQYDYYPTRDMILKEFNLLWDKQAEYHPTALSDKAREDLREMIDFQNPLKPQEIEKCSLEFEAGEPRAPKALPLVQKMIIYQNVNHLRVKKAGQKGRPLTLEERDKIAKMLLNPSTKKNKTTFKKDIPLEDMQKEIGLAADEYFNSETHKKTMKTDETAHKMWQDEYWGAAWFKLNFDQQTEVIEKLLGEDKHEDVVEWLCEEHELDEEKAKEIAYCFLPTGYNKLSVKAIKKILPELEKAVIPYSEARKRADYEEDPEAPSEVFDTLPYYGEVMERRTRTGKKDGQVANPTVHVALNQLQRVVNDLLRHFGTPEQVVVEVSRNLPLSTEERAELIAKQERDRRANEKRAETLENNPKRPLKNTYNNRLKLRLWEELERLVNNKKFKAWDKPRCIYTSKEISKDMLFTGELEVDHILPRSKTFQDQISNRVLCLREDNKKKNNLPPYQAFHKSPDDYNWADIFERAQNLPKNKKWRFDEDAMEQFEAKEAFAPRHLNDTRYASKLAREYLSSLFGDQGKKGSVQKVWVIKGELTADLRYQWGLNGVLLDDGDSKDEKKALQKNRNDHRHHAIDAIVIGCTDRATVKRASEAAKKHERHSQKRESQSDKRLLVKVPPPWSSFRDDVKDVVRDIIVSHKPDHDYRGAFLEDTAYALVKGQEVEEKGKYGERYVKVKKELASLGKKAKGGYKDNPAEDLKELYDENLKKKLIDATRGLKGEAFTEALLKAGGGMRQVGIKKQKLVKPICDKDGEEYKAYKSGSNYCLDIWEEEDGSWGGEIISTFEAYELAAKKGEQWWREMVGRNGKPLLMRIRKNDYLEIGPKDNRIIVKVYKMTNGRVYYAEHFESNVAARSNVTTRKGKIPEHLWLTETSERPSGLKDLNAEQVTVSPSGKDRKKRFAQKHEND